MRSLLLGVLLMGGAPAWGAVPTVANGVPASAFAGEQFCADFTLNNTGSVGYGPYLRLSLPPAISLDSAQFLGTAVPTADVGVFPAAPGNQLTDPRIGSAVAGSEGDSLHLLVYPVGSVVAGGPDLVVEACMTIASSAEIGTPLAVTVQPVYEFGDTATGVNGPIEGSAQTQSVTPELMSVHKADSAPESERTPSQSFPYTYTLSADVANGKSVHDVVLADTLPPEAQYAGPIGVSGGVNCSVTTEPSTSTPGGALRVDCARIDGGAGNDVTVTIPVHLADVLDETTCTTDAVSNTLLADAEYPDDTPLGQASAVNTLTAKHVAIQKGAAPSRVAPGESVTFTLNFQVTDHGDADSLVITDTLGDGLTYAAFGGLSIDGTPVALSPSATANADGTWTLVFDVVGAHGTVGAGSSGTLTYTATVDQTYYDGGYVLADDAIATSVTADYSLLQGAGGCSDGSAAGIRIDPVTVSKSIVNPAVEYVPGDTVTFRFAMAIPAGDTEGVVFKDFLPLPVFDATAVDTTFGVDVRHAPADTLGLTPSAITVDAATNALTIEWPDIHTEAAQTLAVDLDVTVVDDPFADGLYLTNLVRVSSVNTPGEIALGTAPVQLHVRAPVLSVTHGVSATGGDGSIAPVTSPIDGDLSDADAGDSVTFVITVDNEGGADAYDVLVNGTVPAGLGSCALQSVTDGSVARDYSGDLFGAGLSLDARLPKAEQALITYTCSVDSNVSPRQALSVPVSVDWASATGAVNFPSVSDSAGVTIAGPGLSKGIDSVSPAGGNPYLTPGDTVRYRITVTLPEGETAGLTLTDALPTGLEYLSHALDTAGFAGSVSLASATPSGTVAGGQSVAFAFGATTGVTADNDPSNDSFALLLDARVDGSVTGSAGAVATVAKSNSVSLDYTGRTGSAINANVSRHLGRPDLAVTKGMSPATVDAGDTVEVTLTVTNNGTTPAYDISVSDTLNSGGTLFDLTTVAEQTTPAGYTYAYADPTVSYTADAGTALAAGASATFVFTATVQDAAVTGSTFSNSVSVDGDSQDGVVTGEVASSAGDTATVDTSSAGVSKSLSATSETFTSNNRLAIGEVATYEVRFTLPEGVTQEDGTHAIIVDQLPAGMEYLTGTATLRAVADSGISGSVYGPLPTSATAYVPTVNGNALEFDLGSFTNSDADADAEQVVITYQAVLKNVSDNNRTKTWTNTARLYYANRDGNSQSVSGSRTIRVGEPDLAVTKGVVPTTASGGDTVTFSVEVSNRSTTDATWAWEPALADALPADYLNPQLISAVLSRGSVDVSGCAAFVGNDLSLDLSCLAAGEQYLAPGESITVVYTADLPPDAQFDHPITNTALVTATSLPGDRGTADATPGAPDSDTGERTGSGGNNTSGQAVNDLTAADSATVTVGSPTLTLSGATDLQVGETTVQAATVSVPVGTTNNFVVTIDLPAGLRYTGTPVTIDKGTLTTSLTPSGTPAADSDPLVFDFGTVTNGGSSSVDLGIGFEVQVVNAIGNQDGDVLTTQGTLDYLNAAALHSDVVMLTVIEPNLDISRSITAGASGSDAGDTVTYRVEVTNFAYGATAYAVSLADVLPAGLLGAPDGSGAGPYYRNVALVNPGAAVVLNSDGSTPLAATDALQQTTTNAGDTLTWPLFDLPPQTTLTYSYDVVVANDAPAGSLQTTHTRADYRSLAVADGSERDAADAGDDDNDADLDNYSESDSIDLTLDASMAIQATLDSSHPDADFAIGDEVRYDLRVDVVEGTLGAVEVTAVLPAGLTFESMDGISAGTNVSYDGPGTAIEAPAGTLTIDLGTITNPADADGSNDWFVVDLRARVDDEPGNAAGTTLTTAASVSSAVGNAGPDTVDVAVVEPNLSVTKEPDDAAPSLGDEVTFTVTVRHDGSGADAFDVVLSDPLPAGLSYVTGSTVGASVDESDTGRPLFDLGAITLIEGSKSFSFRAGVDADAAAGQPIANTIGVEYDSQSGSPAVQRGYSASGSGSVTPGTPATIDAYKAVALVVDAGTSGQVDPGDTVEYSVRLSATAAVDEVLFTDVLPAELTYAAGTLASDRGSVDDSAAPSLRVVVGSLGVGEVANISFRATVNAGVPAGSVVANQGLVDSAQTVPEPTDADGEDANGDQPTLFTVGGAPDLGDALYVQKIVQWWDDADASDDVTAGDAMRYVFFIRNRGAATLTNVALSDTLPAGLSAVSASEAVGGSGNSIGVTGSALTVDIPSLAVGEVVIASLEVTIDAFAEASKSFTNQGSAASDQTAGLPTDANGDPGDGYQATEFVAVNGGPGSPALDLQKRWSLAADQDGDGLVDPGDTLEYRLTLRNGGAAAADDVRLSDGIPSHTSVVAGSVATSQGLVLGEDPVSINVGSVAAGAVVTARFRVTVAAGTPDGTLIANQAVASATALAPVSSDDNGIASDGINPTLTPVDTGAGSGGGTPSGLTRSLYTTSEADSSGSQVLVGEVLGFEVEFTVAAGTTREVTLLESLPGGLAYIPGSATLARTFDTGLNAARDPGGINSEPVGSFVPLLDGSEVQVAADGLSVALGDVINSDADGDAETYRLRYDAVVVNGATNQAGSVLTSGSSVSWRNGLLQLRQLTAVTTAQTVLEPALTLGKSVSPAAMLVAGGTVTFTLTLENPGAGFAATAYDVRLIDTLPTEWTSLSVDAVVPSGGAGAVTDNSSGTSLDLVVAAIPPGGGVTVTMSATADGPLSSGAVVNTANATWTSLPGASGSGAATPGAAGASDGERTGSGGGSNDYAVADSASVYVGDVALVKSVVDPQTRYAVGDSVDYRVTLSLPPGLSAGSAQFADVLAEGLSYVIGSLAVSYDDGVTSSTTPGEFVRTPDAPGAGEETLALDFGTLANASGSAAGAVLTYSARVDNIAANQDNAGLANAATLDFVTVAGGSAQRADGASVTVGEPQLALVHSVVGGSAGLDAGDPVAFRLAVSNTGTTAAYDVVLSDSLPAGLEAVTGLQVASVGGGAQTPNLTNDGDGWSSAPFDLPVGAQVVLEFSASLDGSVLPGQALQNRVDAVFSSRDGSDPNERDGSGGVNDYAASAAAPSVTVADPVQLDKRFHPDAANTTYTVGEAVTYRLTVDLIEGTVADLVVSDTLPADVTLRSVAIGVGNPGVGHEYVDYAQSGRLLTFAFGEVVNPANALADDDFLTVDVTVTVDDVPANSDGAVLGNDAAVAFTGPGGPVTRDFDADAAVAGVQPLEATVVEPLLALVKSSDRAVVPPGDSVTFTLLLDHLPGSSADAYDLSLVDTLPSGLVYVEGSASAPVQVDGSRLTFTVDALTRGDDQLAISYRARVDAAVSFGALLENSAELDYSGLPGTVAGERAYAAGDSAAITAATTTFIEALKGVSLVLDQGTPGVAEPGDTLEYQVVLDNAGAEATHVVFSDTLPAQLSYVAGSLSSTAGSVSDAGSPTLSVLIDTLPDGGTATIRYRAVIAAGTPAGSVIENQGVVDSDQTVPEPTDADGVDGNGDQPTRTPVGGGGGGAALYAQKLAEWLDDADSSGTISPGDRMRYRFILSNTGDQTLTGVRLDDSVPAGLTPVAATAQVSGSGNSAALSGRDLLVTVPVLAAGQQVSASLEVQVDSPLYNAEGVSGIESFTNQGSVVSDQTGAGATDANGDPADGTQPTRFTAADGAAPASQPDVEKRWSLAGDADGDGVPGPGDTLEFRILVAHGGPGPIDDLRLEDTVPVGTSLVAGSVHSSRGIVVSEDPVQVNVGSLAPGASVEVAFRVRVDAVPPAALVLNQAQVSGGNIQPEPSDNDADDGNGLDPVQVPIGQITGLVFSDQNRNGLRDAGEGVVAGAPVALYEGAGGLVASLQSATDGRYRFAGLAPGQYTVVETDLEGYISSTPNSVSASLLSSQSATVDFGDVYGGSVTGSVFRDGDGDGVRGAGEAGLGGVTVRLLDAAGAVYAATVTDTAGDFLFEGVVPGSYRAEEQDPPGYTSTSSNTVPVNVVAAGLSRADFGDVPGGSLSGRVFEDIDGDGAPGAGETGLAGIAVRVLTAAGHTSASVVTDGDGAFFVAGLTDGRYSVVEQDPAGYFSTSPNRVSVNVAAGGAATALFGDVPAGGITGVVFEDLNGNGAREAGESGIAAVSVAVLDTDGAQVAQAATDADGVYRITGLAPGAYAVEESDPPGYVSFSLNTLPVSVPAGGAAVANFAEQRAGSVSGVVFFDRNRNFRQDQGEPGFSGVSITLYDGNGALQAQQETDAGGHYRFDAVTGGHYRVEEQDPAGLTSTTPNRVAVSVAAGGSATANFGDQLLGTVSGTVFDDFNGSGLREQGERGLSGVVVSLTATDGRVLAQRATGGDGGFLFADVEPGTYVVVEQDPDGFFSTTHNRVAVNVIAGGAAAASFGDRPEAQISGEVFNDLNGNGVRDATEKGLAGVSVALSDTRGYRAQVATSADGRFLFPDLRPGNYRLWETDPEGFVSTTDNQVLRTVTVGGADTARFGDQLIGTISGTVFVDTNGNGAHESGESGMPGVRISLSALDTGARVAAAGPLAETVTVGDGSYILLNVAAGDYQVDESDPEGFASTTPNSVQVTVPYGGAGVVNFGELLAEGVGGTVYDDVNGNGRPDAGERGIGGVSLELWQEGGLVASTLTGDDGVYRFDALSPGSYSVRESDPAGYTSTTANQVAVTVSAEAAVAVNFGDRQAGSISGQVFEDADLDASLGSTERGLGGVTVTLRSGTGDWLASELTGSDGLFAFSGLPAGDYSVSAGDLDGYASTTPNEVALTLPGGGAASALFGDHLPLEVFGVPFDPRLLALAALVLAWFGMRAALAGGGGAAGPYRRR